MFIQSSGVRHSLWESGTPISVFSCCLALNWRCKESLDECVFTVHSRLPCLSDNPQDCMNLHGSGGFV